MYNTVTDPLTTLHSALLNLPSGPLSVERVRSVERLLTDAWGRLGGPDLEKTFPQKLRGRTEQMAWKNPELTFVLERHAGTVRGSSRADLHYWCVNIETGEARIRKYSYRQIRQRAKPLDVRPLAEEVARAIVDGKEHSPIDDLLGLKTAPKQTAEGRRRRFASALSQALAELRGSPSPSM